MSQDFLYYDLLSFYSESKYNSKYQILPIYKLICILLSIGLFHLVYLYSKAFSNDNLTKTKESFVSLTHSSVACILTIYVLTHHHSLWTTPRSYSEPIPYFSNVFVTFSYGYFVWDVYISFATKHGLDFRIHALFCLLIYSFATFTPFLHRPALIVLLFEGSTVFLQLSGICKKRGWFLLMFINKCLFTVTFFIFRIVIGSFVTYEMWQIFVFGSLDVDITNIPKWFWMTVLIVNAIFHILNIYWYSIILPKAIENVLGKVVDGKKMD